VPQPQSSEPAPAPALVIRPSLPAADETARAGAPLSSVPPSKALPSSAPLSSTALSRMPPSKALPSKAPPPPPSAEPSGTIGLPPASALLPGAGVPGERPKMPEPELITGSAQTDTLTLGQFTLRPAVEVNVGYDTNPRRVPNAFAKGSSLISPAFKLDAESNWDSNALTVNLRGRMFSYQQVDSANRFDGVADATYRYDINDSTWLFLNARASSLSEQSPENLVLAAPDATVNEVWGSARLLKKFGRYFASLGLWEGFTDVAQTPGRSYTTTMGALRGGYEVSDGLTPYAELLVDRRNYEGTYINNIQRSSNGYQPTVGLSYKFNDKLTAEGYAGYLWRDYENALVETTQWPVFGLVGSWQISPTSSLQGRIRTGINETTIGGAFGAKENLVGATWRQLFGERLALFASLDLSQAEYVGVPGQQKRAFGEIAAEYALTRYLVGRLSAQRDVLTSTYSFNSYEANVFMAGLKVVR
jgi:hypothetical protein